MREQTDIIKFIDEVFEEDNWEHLSVNPRSIKKYLSNLLPKKEIVAIRFLPFFDNNNILKYVHLVALSKTTLYHSQISQRFFEFREIPIIDVVIKTIFHFGKKKELKSIELLFDIGDTSRDGAKKIYRFEIPAALQNHILSLVSQINKFKSVYYREFGDY